MEVESARAGEGVEFDVHFADAGNAAGGDGLRLETAFGDDQAFGISEDPTGRGFRKIGGPEVGEVDRGLEGFLVGPDPFGQAGTLRTKTLSTQPRVPLLCPLLTAYCPLIPDYRLLITDYRLLITDYCSLFTAPLLISPPHCRPSPLNAN